VLLKGVGGQTFNNLIVFKILVSISNAYHYVVILLVFSVLRNERLKYHNLDVNTSDRSL